MKEFFVVLCLTFFPLLLSATYAQDADSCQQFIQFREGSKECFDEVTIETMSNKVVADGKEISILAIDRFATANSFYMVDWPSGHPVIYKSYKEGKRIKLFNQLNSKTGTMYNHSTGTVTTTTTDKDVYSKDGGPLREVKMKSLKRDLSDNPESMKVLKNVSKRKMLQAGLYTVGYSSIIIGGVVTLKDISVDPSDLGAPKISPILLLGGLTWAAYSMRDGNKERLFDAIDLYNDVKYKKDEL
ncbi:MAG: hypothetical protein ABFS32_08260 [Bacteroidota bacterium]